jgi:hypothetical protein
LDAGFDDANPGAELPGGIELKEFVFCEVPLAKALVEFGLSLTEFTLGSLVALAS